MADRFDKFSARGRRVLTLAQEEAQRFNHNYIGTEHLLLGLVREGEGVAAIVLGNLGVKLEAVRAAVEFIIGRGDRLVMGEIGLTPRAKRVIELAVDEARRLNHGYIGTEHLLLGLIREGEGIAVGVLESLGVNLERASAEVMRVLENSAARAGEPLQGGPVAHQTVRSGAVSPEVHRLIELLKRLQAALAAAMMADQREVVVALSEQRTAVQRLLDAQAAATAEPPQAAPPPAAPLPNPLPPASPQLRRLFALYQQIAAAADLASVDDQAAVAALLKQAAARLHGTLEAAMNALDAGGEPAAEDSGE